MVSRLKQENVVELVGYCIDGPLVSLSISILQKDLFMPFFMVNPIKYKSMSSGFSTLWREQGPSSLWRGWTSIFFLSSASAQIFADVALCPFESVKVRVQTQPHFAKGGFPKVYATEGLAGFYKGLFPLCGRNLPFSMIMFSSFEHSVDLIYKKFVQKKKEDCSRVQQLGVTCLAAYAAGAVGTLVCNPADNIVASLYNKKAENVIQAVKKIGLFNLFARSLPVRITIVSPVITMQWLFYDTIKVLTGL
ncbi:hypothetical protein Patl1_35734 [Pistacia atlantica]|nr:hypothetical protein Patl1_35734 [Pistacia atlantica]